MKILVTGSKGFIGKNLIATLENIRDKKDKSYGIGNDIEIFECDIETTKKQLESFVQNCDFVFHLAGINRPLNAEEFMLGNYGFTTQILELLKKHSNKAPILMSSSIQADLNNDYGISKKQGEDYLLNYGVENGVTTYIFRLPNVFGKWCKPNYNSVVATFCHNIANDLEITINDRNKVLELVYIDDVVRYFINALSGNVLKVGDYCVVGVSHCASLGQIADLLYSYKQSRIDFFCPNVSDEFSKKLYSTYLSYLPTDSFAYALEKKSDERGSFTEFLKTKECGQFSVNISKPHITKGNHWHHTKVEKFFVVQGNGVIRFKAPHTDEIVEYFVNDIEHRIVDIPVGYSHNIENLGDNDMVTIMWANENFNPNNSDTYYQEIKVK